MIEQNFVCVLYTTLLCVLMVSKVLSLFFFNR